MSDVFLDDVPPMWTLEQGLELARKLEPLAIECGFHIAVGGGVMLRGSSNKDLDLFFYPHCKSSDRPSLGTLIVKLHKFGFKGIKAIGTSVTLDDQKDVRWAYLGDKRIDFFFVS